jgi:hypothetical protein
MLTVQHTKHFAHPANWAGFMLVGADVRLSNKVALMGQALCELLKNPEKCRDALRVTLHLVSCVILQILRIISILTWSLLFLYHLGLFVFFEPKD